MKILHVISNLSPLYGGPSKACVEMASIVAKAGHDVTIFTTNKHGRGFLSVPLNQPVEKEGVTIYYFAAHFPHFWATSFALARALRSRVKEFDVVHIHSLYFFHLMVASYYCRKFKIPYIIRPHGTLDPYIYRRHRFRKYLMEWLFQNRAIKKAAAIQFTAEEEATLAKPYVFSRPYFVVPNGLNPEDYRPLPAEGDFKRAHPFLADKKIILFLSRINFKKGLDILIKAMPLVLREVPNAHLVLAGQDNEGYLQKVNQWGREQKVEDHMTFVGMLEGQEKLAAFHDADVFTLPSYSENFGIVVIESLICETPVVISNNVNIWREIEEAKAGLVIDCDVEQLAKALIRLLQDEALNRDMQLRGKKLVETKFAWSTITHQLIDMYQTVIKRGKASCES